MKFTRIKKIFTRKRSRTKRLSKINMSASSLYSFSYCETFGDDDENINNEDEYQKALSILNEQKEFHQHNTEIMMLSPCPERFCPLCVIYEEDGCEEQEIESSAHSHNIMKKPRTVMDLKSLTAS
uniref:Uncharacterized protein n=1 Tax=Sundstroemia setigera TaxID=3005 RepID=A0A7S0FC44_9STRA|mmetsp:Transcript_436/g.522  ORF Transcript_436/g.522 Transcript_436/m.522 type:complete len:125 (+) Transcript_436:54-428(+)